LVESERGKKKALKKGWGLKEKSTPPPIPVGSRVLRERPNFGEVKEKGGKKQTRRRETRGIPETE